MCSLLKYRRFCRPQQLINVLHGADVLPSLMANDLIGCFIQRHKIRLHFIHKTICKYIHDGDLFFAIGVSPKDVWDLHLPGWAGNNQSRQVSAYVYYRIYLCGSLKTMVSRLVLPYQNSIISVFTRRSGRYVFCQCEGYHLLGRWGAPRRLPVDHHSNESPLEPRVVERCSGYRSHQFS